MEELKISKSNLVGLSQGGAIALQFVIDNPKMVKKLVLVDAAGLGAKVWAMIGMLWMNNAHQQQPIRLIQNTYFQQ
ncbi:pimeloyl-ACP methyl ester carboxylesterase [Mesonia maritima]|uniref:Pimeloyl-ACP methyl ester carboxylesterase n=1 Tax=Mesonia maritima TaxID=1793873 RepID=A0ABU1K5R7_9FLAO|nr:pimeloyl-ACP methyl ester carboxylesterase [Mesonia maritima]